MKKIGDSTSTANGSGEWTEGNPGAGLPATLLKADWLTTIQRELINVVLGGGLTLDSNDDSQLFKAIQALQTAASTWAKLSGKPTTVAGFGLLDVFTKTETGAAIQTAISALVASSPAALDTLKELATALGNDPNFATSMTNALAGKAAKATSLAGYSILDAFTKAETTVAIQQAIAALVASSPAALDTLNELAAALGNDPNFATTMTNALAAKANKSDVLTAAQVNAALAQCIKLGQIVLGGSNPVFQSNGSGGIASITEGSGVLQVSGGDLPSSAVMCFHRPGSYGAMFGLDTDNQLKVGGWSMGALAHTIWHSGNRPKDTALLAPTGWSKNADTGEINQWIEYVVGDIGGAHVVSVTWPFKFPSQCLNVRPSLRLATNAPAGVSVSFSDHTATGCTVRIEEWTAIIQTGLVLVVEARGL